MYCIEIQPVHSQQQFLRYLKVNATTATATASELSNYFININSDNTSLLYPAFGEFNWSYKDDKFLVSFHEEGEPVTYCGGIEYFHRLFIRHDNLKLLEDFVREALTSELPTDAGKVHVMCSKSKGYWDDHSDINSQSLDSMYLPLEMKRSIVDNIDLFLANKARYIRFGRSYKLAYLLSGVPGSGKTSLVKAIALKYSRPLYVLNFTKGLTDESLIDLMSSIKDDSILLIEDIDAYFIDRKPQDINVSFSILINILDGTLVKGNGTIIFLSANKPDRLDPALIRPGRVDHILNFNLPLKAEVHAAFKDLTSITDEAEFIKFYTKIKSERISMSGIVDFLFRYPATYMDKMKELLEQTSIYHHIVNDQTDKLYL